MAASEVLVREAIETDAQALANLLSQVLTETDYITKDSLALSASEMAAYLRHNQLLSNQICLVLTMEDKLIGLLNVAAEKGQIGDIFLAVAKEYWGYGLGSLLLDVCIDWAEHTDEIEQLKLTVQTRNERAIHLYRKFGFEIEGTQITGAKTKNGERLSVYRMARQIGEI